jgi:hypothetical protein
MELDFTGSWTFFLNDSRFIQGISSDFSNTAMFKTVYGWPMSTQVLISNFSQISKQSQLSFYLSLRTPLLANTYNLTITAFKANGKIAEFYTKNIVINQTTGYIR